MEHEATVYAVGTRTRDDAPVVVLDADGRRLPILVTEDQAHAIWNALHGEQFQRPLTHDLLVELVADFGGAVDRVRIDALVDGTYYAKLDTEQYHGGERRRAVFDVRASDAIAIALRADCPVYVDGGVLDEAGHPPEHLHVSDYEDERFRQ